MNFPEINEWENKLKLIDINLTELNESNFVRIIRSNATGLSAITYQGKTLVYATNAIDLLDKLWLDYARMKEVIIQAKELQNKKTFFRDYSKEIIGLLNNPVIQVETENIPLSARELTSTNEHMLTLKNAQSLMMKQFSEVRDSLIKLHEIEENLKEKIDLIDRESQAINEWQKRLGQNFNIPVFNQIFKNDPLEALGKVNDYQKTLDGFRDQLQDLENMRKSVLEKLQKSKSDLESLKELIKRNYQAVIKTKETFMEIPEFFESVNISRLASFDTWIDYLQETYKNSPDKLPNLMVGVKKCHDSVADLLTQEQTNYVKNRKLLDELSDLQGRFNAFNYKAKVMMDKGFYLDKTLDKFKEEAKKALSTKPINIVEVRNLVRSFEIALR